ncbi:hypothetical protein CBL_10122 [Carabus blaptoides fortunei]
MKSQRRNAKYEALVLKFSARSAPDSPVDPSSPSPSLSLTFDLPNTSQHPFDTPTEDDHLRRDIINGIKALVDHDVSLDEIKDQLLQDDHNIKNLWRIKSRAHDKDIRLIRIVTTSQHTLGHLLASGFTLFFQHQRIEVSHAPKPQLNQYHRSQEFKAPDA